MRTSRSALSLLARAPARSRLLEGARPLIQPHNERPKGTIDMLSGKLVEATNDELGWELPNVDLTQDFSFEDIETLQQASDDAGGILICRLRQRQAEEADARADWQLGLVAVAPPATKVRRQ